MPMSGWRWHERLQGLSGLGRKRDTTIKSGTGALWHRGISEGRASSVGQSAGSPFRATWLRMPVKRARSASSARWLLLAHLAGLDGSARHRGIQRAQMAFGGGGWPVSTILAAGAWLRSTMPSTATPRFHLTKCNSP